MSPPTKQQQGRSIALVGAGGHIGKPILDALLALGIHDITILTRPDSASTAPANVKVHQTNYTTTEEPALVEILSTIDVLIVAVAFTAYAVQTPLFRAAAAAGVKYILPCEFGGDPNAKLRQHLDVISEKDQYRALVEELGVSSWIGVVCGPWFEFTIQMGGLGVDVRSKTASLLGSEDKGFGVQKASVTTFKRTGEMVAGLLSLPEEKLAAYKNRWVFFSSFTISQQELLDSVKRVTGSGEGQWTIKEWTVEELLATSKQKMQEQETFMEGRLMMLQLVFGEGLGGDFSAKVLDSEELGLQPEDLDEVVRGVV
ncbi:uncharacterized protein B0I36DRAFT_366955 [Microdochium trichocladiopsis]|uniref:NmrA-like domain-containing protein n=1 Tax=Microdochium trichocladiopsis TaxID=1682393 RepID=A0A9P9BLN5_9PEZI|nr:uncharacterized protein B0I36DRAFT_366955 [Microdochium trichocladiopsis]KAH7025059.1 hypothetical protein B0I36DRAFT_366955 [Microdochium trichocladiopsis]